MAQVKNKKVGEKRLRILGRAELVLRRCLLIGQKEKKFWMEKLVEMPDLVIENLIEEISDRNVIAEKYLRIGLADDKKSSWLKKISDEIENTKLLIRKNEEAESSQNAEEILNKLKK